MNSLTLKESNQKIVERINNLSSDTAPLWGKMNSGQMLAHCTVGLRIANGEVIPKSNIVFKLLGRLVKRRIISQESFKKNSRTAREFIISEDKNFNEEKDKILKYLREMEIKGYDFFTKKPHAIFGPLKPEEWDTISFRHFDHHLKQFGV
ncbi:MAG: DUF1569 domain-containing protein [Ignavibacteria bacterium]